MLHSTYDDRCHPERAMSTVRADRFLAQQGDIFLVIGHPSEFYSAGDVYFTETSIYFVPYVRLACAYDRRSVGNLALQMWRIRAGGGGGGLVDAGYRSSGAPNELTNAANVIATIRSKQWGTTLEERFSQGLVEPLQIHREDVIDASSPDDGYDCSVHLKLLDGSTIEFGAVAWSSFAESVNQWRGGDLPADSAVALLGKGCSSSRRLFWPPSAAFGRPSPVAQTA